MNKKIRPIIKWTGGKYNEFALFENYIPEFKRYIEPFFGGGGVFFALQPTQPCFINDKSTDLINFYKQINQPLFQKKIYEYVSAWDEIGALNKDMWSTCGHNFIVAVNNPELNVDFKENLELNYLSSIKTKKILKDKTFIINELWFEKSIISSIIDKARRIARIVKKENRLFNDGEIQIHFETSIRSGAYLFFRSLLNKNYTQQIQLDAAKAAANWYFVREFCYGSMFRFNAKGEFNIPYGGIAYNKKNFKQKVDYIFAEETQLLFNHSEIFNLDFEAFLNQVNLQPADFIFLDPPYDSEFSEYDQSAFTQKDQQRLADFLIKTPAKWMVVIKETDFIRRIYTHPNIKINTFNKSYTYNVRGRNNRDAVHLIITNY